MAYGNYAPFYRTGFFNPMQTPTMPNMAENQQYIPQYQQSMPQMQQNIHQQPMQMSVQPMPQKPTNELIWVQGLEGAKGFLVAPNNTVVLWDTENPVIYIKTADMNGIPSMRVLDFIERNGNVQNSSQNDPKKHECKCGDNFATKEQIKALEGKIDDLTAKYEELSNPVIEKSKSTSKKAKESEE